MLFCVSIVGCDSETVAVKPNTVPDFNKCHVKSDIIDERKMSQLSCHEGVKGNGTQVLFSKVKRSLTFKSDTYRRELTSIFMYPVDATEQSKTPKFDAFYSDGQYELMGKTGCNGIFDGGTISTSKNGEHNQLEYDIRFKLVTASVWPDDCHGTRRTKGKVDY